MLAWDLSLRPSATHQKPSARMTSGNARLKADLNDGLLATVSMTRAVDGSWRRSSFPWPRERNQSPARKESTRLCALHSPPDCQDLLGRSDIKTRLGVRDVTEGQGVSQFCGRGSKSERSTHGGPTGKKGKQFETFLEL